MGTSGGIPPISPRPTPSFEGKKKAQERKGEVKKGDIEEILTKSASIIADWGPQEGLSKIRELVADGIDEEGIAKEAPEIIKELQQAEKEAIPDKADLDKRINDFVRDLSTEKKDRESALKEFMHIVDLEFEGRVAKLKLLEEGPAKMVAIEQEILRISYLGSKLAELVSSVDSSLVDSLNMLVLPAEMSLSGIKIGIQAFSCQQRGKQIVKLQSVSEGLNSALLKTSSSIERRRIENELQQLDVTVAELKKANKAAIVDITTLSMKTIYVASKKSLAFFSDHLSHILPEGSEILSDLCLASSAVTIVGGSLLLGVNSYLAYNNSVRLSFVESNIIYLEGVQKRVQEPEEGVIIGAKLDHLKTLHRELQIQLAQKVMGITASMMTIGSTVVGIAGPSAAVTGGVLGISGALAGTAATTMGVGALVLGVGLAVGGATYAGYRYRHELMYANDMWDVYPRKHFNESQLHRQTEIFNAANEELSESEKTFKDLQLLLSAAWETKEEMDNDTGPEALKRQALISRKIVDLEKELKTRYEKTSQATTISSIANKKLKQIRSTLVAFASRKKDASALLEWRRTVRKFSKYDSETILHLESYLRETLKNEKPRKNIQNMLQTHGFSVIEPLTFEQVLGFIIDDKTVVSQSFG